MRSAFDLPSAAIKSFHDRYLRTAEPVATTEWTDIWRWIEENHRCNAALWKEEDRARRDDVPDAEIVRCKRGIDAFNQRRNDAVELLDQCILAAIAPPAATQPARLSSETVGAMIDRLSILALKIHHMGLQTKRQDTDETHLQRCREKLSVLVEQRNDLAACLDRLLFEVRRGATRFKTYRQFKMYNDPTLNPELYGRRRETGVRSRKDEETVVDVLIHTCDRPAALAVTLTSLFSQTHQALRIVISDQGDEHIAETAGEVQAVLRLIASRGCEVEVHRHLPRQGLAEQRDFLLANAKSSYALFLDDAVVLEPDLVARLLRAIREQGCGFVGSGLIGLSHADDRRPEQQRIEFWDGPVEPEEVVPDSEAWERHHLHSAANLLHLQERLRVSREDQRLYRVAWIGGCVLFDTDKLRSVGGFGFWRDLPAEHRGEDVVAQQRMMARYGGCGVFPAGAYHQELETTVPWRQVETPRALDPERL